MDAPKDPIPALVAALAESPDNVLLRRHLADQLADRERFEEAEVQYRELLARLPGDDSVRLALARTYLSQGKTAHADILVELVTGRPGATAQAFVLLAQIRIAERDFRGARVAFRAACDLEPALEASDVAADLGVGPTNPFELEEDLEDLDLGIQRGTEPSAGSTPSVSSASGGSEVREPCFPRRASLERRGEGGSSSSSPAPGAVGGFEAERAKLRLMLTEPLLRPEVFAAYGRAHRGGLLLCGPSGSGKTHLVRALAADSGLPLLVIQMGEVVDFWRGAAEAHLARLLDDLRAQGPGIVLVEDVDRFRETRHGEGDPKYLSRHALAVVERLVREADDGAAGRSELAFVGTTTVPWLVDPLLIKRGRFDGALVLPPPGEADRREVLEACLSGRPRGELDWKKLVRKTRGASPGELHEMVELATMMTLVDALEEGETLPIREKTLVSAIKEVGASTTPSWYEELRTRCAGTHRMEASGQLVRMLRRATGRG